MAVSNAVREFPAKVWARLQHDNLWKRMVKYGLALTAAVTIAVLPDVIRVFGVSTFFLPLQTMFAHPAQRVGSMFEKQMLNVSGTLVGTAWGSLGLYLSSLVVDRSEDAAFAIRGLFLFLAIVFHGYYRSSTPKLFPHLFFLLMTSFIVLTGKSTNISTTIVTSMLYPVLTANGILFLFGLGLFPEFSSRFLGTATINILSDSVDALSKATTWFVASEELEPALTQHLTRAGTGFSLSQLGSRATRKSGKFGGLYLKLRSILWNPVKNIGKKKPRKASPNDEPEDPLVSLTSAKSDLRGGLAACKAAQREVKFELSISALPLDVLKPISTEGMAELVRDIIAVIGACENKLLMIGPEDDDEDQTTIGERSRPSTRAGEDEGDGQATATGSSVRPTPTQRMTSTKEEFLEKLKLVKPSREMGDGDAELLESILVRIRGPVKEFDSAIVQAVTFLISCLAYCYDVPKLPSGATAPNGILLEEIDLRIDSFEEALTAFDRDSMDEFKQLVASKGEEMEVDILPRFETFLISSFLMGLRQAASHVQLMLRHVRILVEARQARKDRMRIYWPHYTGLREWLSIGGESDAMVLPDNARKSARSGAQEADDGQSYDEDEVAARAGGSVRSSRSDVETGRRDSAGDSSPSEKEEKVKKSKAQRKAEVFPSWFMKLRAGLADTIEWMQASDDLEYAMKLTVAVWVVTWPGFLPSWHEWYTTVRGVWAPLQLILIFEVAIGTSLFIFFIRLFGVIYGCTIGYAAYEIGSGSIPVAVVILVLGIIPCMYVQLDTKYVKAGMVGITTMSVVAIGKQPPLPPFSPLPGVSPTPRSGTDDAPATFNGTNTSIKNFYQRLVAFLIGGFAAILVELFLYPVRARDRLIESLSSTIRELGSMQGALAIGVDAPSNLVVHSPALYKGFRSSRNRAQAALGAAQTFLPFCLSEPRLKGDFKALVPVYSEIIFVLQQIIDKMDTVLALRDNYGSSVLEDLNPLVYAYRRNVAGGMALTLFAVNEALTTRLPLPQFLPSNRTAKLRLINRVRELVARQEARSRPPSRMSRASGEHVRPVSEHLTVPGQGQQDEEPGYASSVHSEAQIAERHKVLAWNASTAGQVEIIEYLEELVELAKLIVGVNAFRRGMLQKLDFGAHGGVRLVGTVSAYPSEDEDEDGGDGDQSPKIERRRTRVGSGGGGVGGVEGGEEGGYGLKRAATYGFESTPPGEEEADLVPVSLQRVGTRMRRESGRRRMSLRGKGKGVAGL